MILIAIQAISRKAKAQINQSIKEGSFKWNHKLLALNTKTPTLKYLIRRPPAYKILKFFQSPTLIRITPFINFHRSNLDSYYIFLHNAT